MITDKDIEKLKTEFKTVFATKEDLNRFATKEDLKRFATKEDLKQFATKDDLKRFATKEDLKGLSTKTELQNTTEIIRSEMQQMGVDIISTMEKIFNDYAERTDKRFESLEKGQKTLETKMDIYLEKISDLNVFKPALFDHEYRIWRLEQNKM